MTLYNDHLTILYSLYRFFFFFWVIDCNSCRVRIKETQLMSHKIKIHQCVEIHPESFRFNVHREKKTKYCGQKKLRMYIHSIHHRNDFMHATVYSIRSLDSSKKKKNILNHIWWTFVRFLDSGDFFHSFSSFYNGRKGAGGRLVLWPRMNRVKAWAPKVMT